LVKKRGPLLETKRLVQGLAVGCLLLLVLRLRTGVQGLRRAAALRLLLLLLLLLGLLLRCCSHSPPKQTQAGSHHNLQAAVANRGKA
jgi:hypothetical protein